MQPKNSSDLDQILLTIKSKIDEKDTLNSVLKLIAEVHLELSGIKSQLTRLNLQKALLPIVKQRYEGLKSIRILPDFVLSKEQGFYELEYDSNGNPFRWTGPSTTFYFDLHLDRTVPLKFVLLVILKSEEQKNIRAFSDNIEIPLVLIDDGIVIKKYKGILMPREVIGLTRIVFSLPKVFQSESPDTRKLGVTFIELNFSPASDEEVEKYLKRG